MYSAVSSYFFYGVQRYIRIINISFLFLRDLVERKGEDKVLTK